MFSLLIVDDEPFITDSLCSMLHKDEDIRSCCEIYRAYNAYEAQFLVENENIDLIMSDVNMPGLDGIGLRNQLLAQGRSCAFIFISGFSDFDNIYQAMKVPNTRFLLKSEPDEVILDAIKEQLTLLKNDDHRELVQTQDPEKKDDFDGGLLPGPADIRLIRKIDDFLKKHLRDEGCLTAVADYIGVSPAYLSRLYKQLTGINFSRRVCQLKIEYAQQLLRETNKKVYEISNEVGFVSSSAFVYFFKKNTGVTPQQYRSQH